MKDSYSVMGGKGVNISIQSDNGMLKDKTCYDINLHFDTEDDIRVCDLAELLLQRMEHFLADPEAKDNAVKYWTSKDVKLAQFGKALAGLPRLKKG